MSNGHLERFKEDIARWIRPGEVGNVRELTARTAFALIYRHPPLRAVGWFRLASWFVDKGIPLVPGFLQRRMLRLYGLELAPGNDIDGGLYIVHPAGCTVFVERLGKNASVIAAVTVGNRGTPRWPRIGDNVFLGAGARVLGDIELGDDVQVGANAVVLDDVPGGHTAVGVPARVQTRTR